MAGESAPPDTERASLTLRGCVSAQLWARELPGRPAPGQALAERIPGASERTTQTRVSQLLQTVA